MKSNNKLIVVIALVFGLFFTYNGYSQNLLQKEPSNEVRELADERARMWTEELGLTAKQQDLVEQKIIEFTMKRIEIQDAGIPVKEKTEKLQALESVERGDMRDILTKPQFERYVLLQEQEEENDLRRNPNESNKIQERQ